ncbi:hypothetical protein PCA31118_04707 [Pandoraea captiosa]|uniref:Uncharacterized protein n=1 Tax=Pandoraea captiosa TaxID=2508302 RepID=A0A5E5ANT2_9BURK|nr:hypothetical protein [Pandoraea captiosa]VVE74225.1 hypothetical protein PCA31118_04707 [Pandoraea captiosa]
MPFELEAQKTKLTSVNPRAELHGEDKKPAVDLKFEVAADNGVLANFGADLRSMLYTQFEAELQQMIEQLMKKSA